MRSPTNALRIAVGLGVPLVLLVLVIAMARRERATCRPPPDAFAGRERLVVAVPEAAAATAAAARGEIDPLADIRAAEDRARQTREDLEGVGRELEERKQELERLRADADADARRSRDEMEQTRRNLERKRDELEETARDAEKRLQVVRDEMQAMEQQRRAQLEAAAGAGVARGLNAGGPLPAGLDPRLARRAGVPRLVPDAAIVAAAGSRGAVPTVVQGQAPGAMPEAVPTTATGALLRAEAERVDAQGRASLNASQAAINARTADALALQNRLAAAEVFFEQRRMNRFARADEAGPRITMSQAIRAAAAARPPRLDDVQLDRVTGEIAWPRLLTDQAYAADVAEIERGFRERAAWGRSPGLAADAALEAALDALVERLRGDVSRHPAGRYGEARVFLDGLRDAVDWYPYD
ncbi:MAG: hypothetical protein ACKOSQ_04140 [Planctomycetaceae bacterium]